MSLTYIIKYSKSILILLILCFSVINSFSQGFDWQKDSRMPYKIPEFYLGLQAGYISINEYGDFNLKEDFIECCKFQDGDGKSYYFGITSEYWYDAFTSFNFGISYIINNSNFIIRTIVPTRNGDFITDYGLNSKISASEIDIAINRRLSNTHLKYGFGLTTTILIQADKEYTEQAISNNVPFEKRIISNGKISDLNEIILSPYLNISYDLDLGIGYYASPNLHLSYNIIDLLKNESWKRFSIGLGIKIYRSLK